jgi:alpha-tubulin suppressor-like RCC1 family protein
MPVFGQWLGSMFQTGYTPAPPVKGKLFSWGYNADGELGIGKAGPPAGPYYAYSSPVQVGALTTWTGLSIGYNEIFGMQSDGSTWGWGQNTEGELGLGDRISRSSPVQIGSPGQWTSLTSGSNSFAAGLKSGKAYLWGNVGGPPILLPGGGYVLTPTQLGARTDWQQINGSAFWVNALLNGNKLYSWGENDWGQLGLGYYTAAFHGASSPIQVGSRTDWKMLVRGKLLTAAALDSARRLWTWGHNAYGQCGINSATARIVNPTQVLGGHVWSNRVSLGTGHFLAIDVKGYLWVWGISNNGCLGLGSYTPGANISSPVQLGSNKWFSVAAGKNVSFGVTTDGKLWSWGSNQYGQLGLGDTTKRSSPTQVGALTTWQACFSGQWTSFGIRS